MKYIYLINDFWKRAQNIDFSHFEIALFFYLLNEFNRAKWPEYIILNSRNLQILLNVNRNTLHSALKKIGEFTTVKYDQKSGSKFIKLIIKPAHKPAQNETQVLMHVYEPAREPAQKPAQNETQVETPIHIYNTKLSKDNFDKDNKDNIDINNNKIISKNFIRPDEAKKNERSWLNEIAQKILNNN